jgi:hypothetical protein
VPGREGVSWLIADVNMHGVVLRRGEEARRPRRGVLPVVGGDVRDTDQDPQEVRRLAPGVSHLDAAEISWNRAGDPAGQPFIFRLILRNNAATHLAETILCNTLRELEAGAFAVFPGVVPVGPLSSGDNPAGSFWPQDASCAAWLDAQPARSVVYVAFGSIASFDAAQLVELAEGLALTARPFLWVVRPGSAGQHQLLGRLAAASRGRVVSWCPQQRVLAHPSVACFVTHCGWNSTIAAVANGVPMLCWPYFTDQFLNQSYVCDVWRTGLGVAGSGTGRVERDKVEELLGDAELKARALALRDLARRGRVIA